MEHQEFLEENHAFAFSSKLTEQVAQSSPPGDIEPESFREIFLRMVLP